MARDQKPTTEDELGAFEDAVGDLGGRVSEFLAAGTGRTPDEIEAEVDDLWTPDPRDDRAVEE